MGLARSAAAVAAALPLTVCGAAIAAATVVEPEQPVGSERAVATVHPALVRVTGTFSGRVHDREGGYANNGEPFTFVITCSGFGVHPDGYLATVGHCVDANDRSVRETFIRAAAEEMVAQSPGVPLEEMITFGLSAWDVEGRSPGSPVASEIRVSGIAGIPSEGVLARVVDDRPLGEGDVGLLKVDTSGLPAVGLATGAGIAIGTRLLVAGYAESQGDNIGPGATPTVVQGSVDADATEAGRPIFRMDGRAEGGTSGAPVFDDRGRVLGINTLRESADGTPINVVIPIGGFTDLLARNGARAELGPRDVRYREALDAHDRGEYTDVIEAIDRLEQEGPTHPRIVALRGDAAAARELHGDASENRLTQLAIWGSAGAAVVLLVVIAALLVARRRRANQVAMALPYPGPFAGPYPGASPRPGGPVPPPVRRAPAGPPHHPYGPAAHPHPVAPRPPVAGPGRPAPRPGAPFDGPTRVIRTPSERPPGSAG
jgi:hypothetical protein